MLANTYITHDLFVTTTSSICTGGDVFSFSLPQTPLLTTHRAPGKASLAPTPSTQTRSCPSLLYERLGCHSPKEDLVRSCHSPSLRQRHDSSHHVLRPCVTLRRTSSQNTLCCKSVTLETFTHLILLIFQTFPSPVHCAQNPESVIRKAVCILTLFLAIYMLL